MPPDRHHDLFIRDVADAVFKDMMAHMEHPFYSLSKKPENTVARRRSGRSAFQFCLRRRAHRALSNAPRR